MDSTYWPMTGLRRRTACQGQGIGTQMRGKPATMRRLRMDRAAWQAARSVPVEITGLKPCLPHFGLALERAAGAAKAGRDAG